MKRLKFHRAIVAIAMMLIGWLPSLAHDFEVDGVFYKKTSDNAVAVTYKGYSYDSYSNEYIGDVAIPLSVKYNGVTYSVTSIGGSAFEGCKSLTSIEIPNSVTSIGEYAFYGCSSLTSIEIPNSVTSIGSSAFSHCSSLTSIEIPNSVTSIGSSAFSGCSSLTSIVWNAKKCSDFSSSSRPFYNSPNITSFTFGDEVEHIPAYLCYNLSSLTSVVWNAKKCSDFSSSSRPFKNSPNITSFTFGDEVEHIPAYLCYNLSSLTSIQIPNSITSIGYEAFGYCSSLTSVVWNAKKCSDFSSSSRPFYNSPNITSFTLGDEVEHIPAYLCYNLSSLTSIEIPNSVTSVGDDAFYSCSSMTSVVWNAIKCSDFSSVSRPFENSPNITSFTFGDEVEHIPAYLCYNLSSLTSIQIPNSVTSIGGSAFEGCKSLTSIEIPNSVTGIGNSAFHDCSSLTSIEIPNSVTSVGDGAFWNCTSLTSIQIPNSITSIGYHAFSDCESLTSVVWNAIKCSDFSSSSRPFENSPNITSFTFGDEVEHIPAYLCYNLSSLTSIQIPNSVTSIGGSAFEGCKSLTSIEIPNSVTGIGNSAFHDCSSLTSIEIPNSVTSIGKSAFYGCSSMTSIQIPNSVTSIGDEAFKYCSGLISIEIPNSVTSIGSYAFYDCSSLTSIQIGNSVTSIGEGAFYYCSSLTSVEIPNSVTSIGECAFCNGEKLTIVVLGNSLTSIEKDAFKGCDNIKKIESKATKAPTIENEDQFSENVYANADLFVPIGYEDNYKYAYAWSEFHNIKGKDFSVKATSISLDKNEVSLKPTQTVVLTETIQPYDTSNKKVTWSSSDESVATIDANGLVTAIAVGEAIITATTTDGSNLSATCKVTVVATLAETITLDKTEISIEATETATLVATVLPELTTKKSVTWTSSNEAVATVDANGVVTAIAVGEATITATTTDGSNLSATCEVTVVATLAETITLDKTEISIEATETATLVATVLPELTTNKSVEWTSSNEAVATVDANGVVTAIALGEAIITAIATDGSGATATCQVTVIPTLAMSIELDKTEVSAEEKSDLQLTATILPEHTTNKEVAWSSSYKWVAKVDNTGLVTMYSAGEVIITATTTDGSNLSATCHINVYSGIDDVEGDNVIVATIGDNIVVKNAKLGSVVNVYSSNGALIKSMTATEGSVVIKAPVKGIYVVAIDGKSFKVMVK